MKAHIQLDSKTRKEIKKLADDRSRKVTQHYFNSIVALYSTCWLIALHKSHNMGNKRLSEVVKALDDTYTEFDIDFENCDIDTALDRLTQAAESRNIDWKTILGVEKIVKEDIDNDCND